MAGEKRKCLALKTTIEIRLVDEGRLKKCEITKKFGVPANSLLTVLMNKSELLKKITKVLLPPSGNDFIVQCMMM